MKTNIAQRIAENLIDRFNDRNSTVKANKITRVFARERELIGGQLSNSWTEVCGHPGRCAIGALLVAAGTPDEVLEGFGSLTGPQSDLLTAAYGLDPFQVSDLMGANDNAEASEAGLACGVGIRPLTEVRVCVVSEMARGFAA